VDIGSSYAILSLRAIPTIRPKRFVEEEEELVGESKSRFEDITTFL
jgi:hypothetical protein